MNVEDRIERRLRVDGDAGVVRDLAGVSPVAHVDEPTGRGPVLERLLDALDPAFAGARPPSLYVHGPKGAGKSAVVGALFDRLVDRGGRGRRAILTTTRAADPRLPAFVTVDARRARTEFGLYRETLEGIADEPVPEHGVGTGDLRDRLAEAVEATGDVVVAVDHVGENGGHGAAEAAAVLTGVSEDVVPVCIGRDPPADLDWTPETTVSFEAYRRHALVDVLTSRVSSALARDAVSHDQVREVAEWAEGDAHDALAATFGAAAAAEAADHGTVTGADLDAGVAAVPRPGVALGRVLALPANRRRVLYELVGLAESERASVGAATEAIAAADGVDLSPSTVRRVLYELADLGVLERVRAESSVGKGRPPSRVEPRFPTRVFATLFERR